MHFNGPLRHIMLSALLASSGLCHLVGAHAAVNLTTTRIIYPGQKNEVGVHLHNNGSTPNLIQAWIDDGHPDASPDEVTVPFNLMPPMARIEANKSQVLRMAYTHEPLASDHESLFWLNVLDIPPSTSGNNTLEFAIHTRIKVFYRPQGLDSAGSEEAPGQVRWKLIHQPTGDKLEAYNPSPYYVTFTNITVSAGPSQFSIDKGGMVAPGTSLTFDKPITSVASNTPIKVDYKYINDYGGVHAGSGSAQERQ